MSEKSLLEKIAERPRIEYDGHIIIPKCGNDAGANLLAQTPHHEVNIRKAFFSLFEPGSGGLPNNNAPFNYNAFIDGRLLLT